MSSFSYSHLSLLSEPAPQTDAVDVFTTDHWGTPVADSWDAQPVEQWENPAPAERWDVTHAEAWRQDLEAVKRADYPPRGRSG